VELSSTAKI